MATELLWRSRTWKAIIALSKASPTFFVGFSAATLGVSYALATLTQMGTNPVDDKKKEEMLRRKGGLTHRTMAQVNKDRLQLLLDEVRDRKGGNERYAKALNGESLGTHTSGTTVGAGSIKR